VSNKVIAKSHNLTNGTSNATTHAEINCIEEISKKLVEGRESFCKEFGLSEKIDIAGIFEQCILFVTCEPCIMCAYALSLVKIKQVYFGCENDRFGGNGSILSIHKGPSIGYESTGGILKDECIAILKRFYERGNEKLPVEKRHRKNA